MNKPTASQPTVLYLHQYFATPDSATGTRSYEMARRLVERGYTVHMITSRKNLAARDAPTVVEGIQLHWLDVPYDNTMGHLSRLLAFFRFSWRASVASLRVPADIVFASSTPLTIAIPALIARWYRRAPMIFEVRDLWPEAPIALGALKHPLPIFLARLLERVAYRQSSHIIALSPGMRDGIRQTGVPSERISVIPNSCDFDVFEVPASLGLEFRAKRSWLGARPLVLYAGTFGKVNGVGWLVELAARVRDLDSEARFLAIGTGIERASVIELAEQRGILNETFFVEDPMPKHDIAAAMSAADICTSVVIPIEALEKNSANKVFDAMAAGKPLLLNYGGWQKELVEEHGLGLACRHDDLDDSASRVARWLSNRERLAAAGARARALGRERFARDRLAEQLGGIVDDVVGRHRS